MNKMCHNREAPPHNVVNVKYYQVKRKELGIVSDFFL